MKLKRLRLQGYKTFASKTEFDFDAGITAVVGPNGSGKSNIADAIRWVLGEQSYSTLRGKRTVDMIFAGSQTRARAGMAQAVLTLDNSDGWLPIDYSEVEIGRRAFRSGENEYLINGQKVRLRDVQDLLATSGLAERTYTIIGQGLIDQALSLRAEERRALFEEAAGVSHYQARRAETLRRLEETQRNLERVHDILSEIRPRLGALKRQANRARTYEQVQADLRQLLRIWYGYQWEQKKKALREQRQLAGDAEADWKESRRRLSAQQDEIDRLRRMISELQDKISDRRAAREAMREKREQAQRQVAVLAERQTSLERQFADIEKDLPQLEEQRSAAQQALSQAMDELHDAQANLDKEQAALARFNQSFEAQQDEIDRWTEKVTELESEQQAEQKRLAQVEGKLAQLQERLQEHASGDDNETALARADEEVTRHQSALDAARQRLEELNEKRRALQQAQRRERKQLKAAEQERNEANRQLNQLSKEAARLEARCDLLAQMRRRETQIGEDVSPIGRLASMVHIPPQHREAIEAAAGARLDTLILADEADLWRLVEANGHEETLSAVALSAVRAAAIETTPDHPDVVGWAIDLVEAEPQAEPVARLLLGAVLVVESREAAYALASSVPEQALLVANDGFVVYAGGLVELRPRDPQHSVLAREAALRTATTELEQKREQLAHLRRAVEEKENGVEQAQSALAELNREQKRLGRLAHEANQRLTRAERNVDRAQQQRDFLEQQQVEQAEELARLKARIAKNKAALERHEEQLVQLASQSADAQTRLEALPVAEAQERRQQQRQEIATARTILAGRQAVVESRRATLQQIEGQLRRQQERQEQLESTRQQLNLEQERQSLDRLQEKITAIDEELQPLLARLDEQRLRLRQREESLSDAQRKAHDQETYYTQTRVALSQRENQMEGLEERIRADLGLVALEFDEEQGGQTPLPIGEVVERLPQVEELPQGIENEIQEARGQLHRIGSVNPDAPREYEETQERYEFLKQQIEDLNQTEKRLRRVVAQLDELTSQAFAATVKKVNGIFGQMFERLFGGGSAHLVLTDPDDLTISGVDIVCRLPSRRQQRLALLSGGERSLTATALIFALLKVAPPPFCVLDEVDAMLDEANINRFRSALRELAKHSQFIVITHNRGTVQAAQTVYGVSMGADSVSQLVSIRPGEYVNGEA
ncbi:MAG: chromosome segregation protein SMC [Chloroflexota bacterium]